VEEEAVAHEVYTVAFAHTAAHTALSTDSTVALLIVQQYYCYLYQQRKTDSSVIADAVHCTPGHSCCCCSLVLAFALH
jgi:hypothetical protein